MERKTRPTEGEPEAHVWAPRRHLRHLVPALILVAVAATAFGMVAADRRSLSASAKPAKPEAVTVKRELPEGVTEDQVPKWVPIRQPSGRTELEPWTSVDAATGRDPEALETVLSGDEEKQDGLDRDRESAEESAEEGGEESGDTPAADAKAEAERPGLLARIRARVLGIAAGADAPGNAEKIPEDVDGGRGEAKGAALPVDPGDRDLKDPTAERAGDR